MSIKDKIEATLVARSVGGGFHTANHAPKEKTFYDHIIKTPGQMVMNSELRVAFDAYNSALVEEVNAKFPNAEQISDIPQEEEKGSMFVTLKGADARKFQQEFAAHQANAVGKTR